MEPFADEPLSLSLQSSLSTPLLLWYGGVGVRRGRATGGALKNQGIIRFSEDDIARLKVFVSMRQLSLFCQLRLHVFCNWNWRIAPSVNISEEETNSEKSEVNFWQLTGSDTGSNIAGGWCWCWWNAEQEVTSAEGLSWRLNRMSCCVPTWPGGDWGRGCSRSQHGSPQDWMNLCPCLRPQEEKELFVPREMSVNQLKELSVKVWVLCSRQLLELRELACNNDGTWRVELSPVVPRKEKKY